MMGYGFNHGYNMMYGFGGVFMLVPIILTIIIVYAIFKLSGRHYTGFSNNSENSTDKALSILKERLAKGEINEEEYITKKNILTDKDK